MMKLQLLFLPGLVAALLLDMKFRSRVPVSVGVIGCFLATTLPFAIRAFRKDPVVALLSPILLAARACAQTLGVIGGVLHARRAPARLKTSSRMPEL